MSQLDFINWMQSLRSPLLDTFFTAINATAEDNFITALAFFLMALRFYPLGKEQVVALKERLDTMHKEKVSET